MTAVTFNFYVDDTQLYTLSSPTEIDIIHVIFDCDINFRHHFSQIQLLLRSSFYHIRDLRRISRHISRDTAKTIAVALIGGTIDYCNSPF